MFEALLYTLKQDMLPLCSDMAIIAKAVAMIGCLIAISMVTLKAMADAVPIDFWALVKPLSFAFCIMMFEPLVIGTLDGIMMPIAKATSALAESQEIDYFDKYDELEEAKAQEYPSSDIIYHLTKEEQMTQAKVSESEGSQKIEEQDFKEIARRQLAAEKEYQKTLFTSILESFLDILSAAARMIINLVGTFFLLILAILGPLAFAAACFPMFENSISNWMSRYISTSLWLPIANLFTAVLSRAHMMLCEKQLDGFSTGVAINNTLLLAMTVVGIFGYFSIPSIASWVIQAGGSGSYARNMTSKGNQAMSKGTNAAAQGMRNMGGGAARVAGAMAQGMKNIFGRK
ncbi:hypothetical protein [Massilibacteroides vaginae]|uniref:hypothetical protein n=1 Tax=Massilibacteroides vaginae TaxID=1673718 RepID=UPI000A1CB9B0|nr:hypothetical protein [Massilibacteroides vaginae]